jgi:hypothetical protein
MAKKIRRGFFAEEMRRNMSLEHREGFDGFVDESQQLLANAITE